MGGDPEYLRLENGPCMSARRVPLPQWVATIQHAVYFLSVCRVALKKKIRGGCLAPRIISHRYNGSSSNPGSGTQKPVPRLRDRMQERRAAVQARKCLLLCISCATRMIVVQIERKNGASLTGCRNLSSPGR